MKKLLLLLATTLACLSSYADVQLVVWDYEHDGNSKAGCPALRTWIDNNQSQGESNGDSWRIKASSYESVPQTATRGAYEKFIFDFSNVQGGLVLQEGNRFCLRDTDNDSWPHYSTNAFPYGGWFSDSGSADMLIGQQITVNSMTVYRAGNSYAITFNGAEPASYPAVPLEYEGSGQRYVLQVWNVANSQDVGAYGDVLWDTSGGLYNVFNTTSASFYPMEPKYLAEKTENNYTYHFLAFNKLTEEQIADAKIPLRYATDNYTAYQSVIGETYQQYDGKLGFRRVADENGNLITENQDADNAINAGWDRNLDDEVYVIDFTEGIGDDRGIYIQIPTLDNLKDGRYDTQDNDPDAGVQRFFRGGIRFEFQDLEQAFQYEPENENYWANAMRFVKWGHIFRLNEVARPLNAFPVFGSGRNASEGTRTLIGWKDDFGPCQWNGQDYSAANWGQDADFGGSPNAKASLGDVADTAKKRGDPRLVTEYPFWLRKIYLHVVTDPNASIVNGDNNVRTPDRRYKRFYLSFEGEYDLGAKISATNEWEYLAPVAENHVSNTPNIFRGERYQFNEPAFTRYYSADLTQVRASVADDDYKDADGNDVQIADYLPMLGCRLSDYLYRLGLWDEAERNAEIDKILAARDANEPYDAPEAKPGTYLYLMEYHRGYSAKNVYTLIDKNGADINYYDLPTQLVGVTYNYISQNGRTYQREYDENNNNVIIGDEIEMVNNPSVKNTKLIKTDSRAVFFDPFNEETAPYQVTADYHFDFPNQNGAYIDKNIFELEHSRYEFEDEIALTAAPVWRSAKDDAQHGVKSSVSWADFTSHTPTKELESQNDYGRFPVQTYALYSYGSTSSERPSDADFQTVTHEGLSFGAADLPTHWLENPKNLGIDKHHLDLDSRPTNYYVHYHLDAWYNMAYLQGGVFSENVFTVLPEVYSKTRGTAVNTNARLRDINHTNADSADDMDRNVSIPTTIDERPATVVYQIRPKQLHGYAMAAFDDTVTGIDATDTDAIDPALSVEYYNLQGIRVTDPQPGRIYIVRQGAVATKALYR